MKHIDFVFPAILVAILTLTACGGHSGGRSGVVSFDSLIVSQINGGSTDSLLAKSDSAVILMRTGCSSESPLKVLSRAGYLYSRSGQFARAIEYLNEAADSMRVMPADSVLPSDAISLLAERANLYTRLGLYEESLSSNSEAIALSKANGNRYLDDLYRMRTAAYEHPYRRDSILAYYEAAMQVLRNDTSARKPLLFAGLRMDIATEFIEHPGEYPDSLPSAIRILEDNIKRLEYAYTPMERFLLGRAYVMRGDYADGIPLMETYVASERGQGFSEDLAWALELMADSYAKAGMGDKLVAIFPEYKITSDSVMSHAKATALIGAMVRYNAAEKEARAMELEHINALLRDVTLYQRIAVGLLLIIAAGIIVYLIGRHRRQLREARATIDGLLSRQQELNFTVDRLQMTVEDLNDELHAMPCGEDNVATAHNGEGDVKTGKGGMHAGECIEEIVSSLKLFSFSPESENKLRRSFTQIYPRFLRELRRDFPALTSNDEMLCILIYLRLSNEEIALTLGINRLSVNSARHRLRKKLSLAETDTSLNDFILSRRP